MARTIDPYYEWLGIPPKDQPPNHYRLLAIELFEDNRNVIATAADRQMGFIKTYQTGPPETEELSQRILNELAAARLCLLNSAKKQAYDKQLRAELEKKQASEPGPASRPRPRNGPAVAIAPSAANALSATVPLLSSVTTPPVNPPLAARSERNVESDDDHSDSSMVPIAIGVGVGCILLAMLLVAMFRTWSQPSSRRAAAVSAEGKPAGPPSALPNTSARGPETARPHTSTKADIDPTTAAQTPRSPDKLQQADTASRSNSEAFPHKCDEPEREVGMSRSLSAPGEPSAVSPGQRKSEVVDVPENRTESPHVVCEWERSVGSKSWPTVLYSNGRIDSPTAPATWMLRGRILFLLWPTQEAPGFILDTANLSLDGKTYSAMNSRGGPSRGRLVRGANLLDSHFSRCEPPDAQLADIASDLDVLLGSWAVTNTKTKQRAEWTFNEDGTVPTGQPSIRNVWWFEHGGVRIRWYTGLWDTFHRPLNPTSTRGDSHTGRGVISARKIQQADADSKDGGIQEQERTLPLVSDSVVSSLQNSPNGVSKISATDLVNRGQETLRSVELLRGRTGADSSLEKLNDGDSYGGRMPNESLPSFMPVDGTVVLFTLNTNLAPSGYEIMSIVSTSGSAARGQARARQNYTVEVAGVRSDVFMPLVHVTNLGKTSAEVQVTTAEKSGSPIAIGVERVRVTFHATDSELAETLYREFDIFGRPIK
jgi:hypothetical protein